jgi:3',5'-cyclic AMP phosphodiesterase CpdA
MRVAVISDPHGDLVALRAVIAELESRVPDEVVVAGDLAQGGPQPAETLDELRGKGWSMVRGNADNFLVNAALEVEPALPATDAQLARAAWAVAQLGPERIEFLSTLPIQVDRDWTPNGGFAVVHATPSSTEDVVLPDAGEELASACSTKPARASWPMATFTPPISAESVAQSCSVPARSTARTTPTGGLPTPS